MATVLCIEDEDHIREDIAELMESAGHRALQASNGKVALEMIIAQSPDLVVSDITMPVMDGRELLAELRNNHPKFAYVPFIFLSALADRDDVLDGMKLGADDYLTKPIDFEMLANKVEASLRQVERMQAQKEQQFVKLFKALSGDAGAEPATAPAAETEPGNVEPPIDGKPEDRAAPAKAARPSACEKRRRKIFGTIFQFGNVHAVEEQLGSHRKGVMEWLEEKAFSFFCTAQPARSSVAKIQNGGVLVCYPDGDKDKADKQSKQLARELEEHLQNDQLDELARETSISRELLAHLVVVTGSLYETEIGLGDIDDPDRFSAAIKEQCDKIYSDERAPTRLSESIKQDKGHLVPLSLITQGGDALPIKFFNYDDRSRQKIRSSFALFGKANLIKSGCLIDLLALGFLEAEARKTDQKDTIVVDVHFETLTSDDFLGLYLSKFMKFVNNSQHKVMMSVRAIPSDITSLGFDDILRPFGKHAAQPIIQIAPRMIEAHANAGLSVSSIVCSYSEMVRSEPDCALFSKTKQHLSKAGILLVLRGLPSENEIEKFSKYGFDGYAVSRD